MPMAAQISIGADELLDEKACSSLMIWLGISAPAMTAGVLLLMYQVGLALTVGLGPLFILSLLFDQTKDFFRRWITYGIGTMFSLAVLSGMTSIVLELTERVATAMWATSAISRMTGIHSQGFSTMAFQQGGVGLMMTLLLISTPMMAAAFFNGPLGSFYSFSQLAGASGASSQQGPYGQAPGTYDGSHTPQTDRGSSGSGSGGGMSGFRNHAGHTRPDHSQIAESQNKDAIKRRNVSIRK